MFKTRLLSGILLVIIALATIIPGNDILFALLLIVSLIGMSELYKIMGVHNKLLGIPGSDCVLFFDSSAYQRCGRKYRFSVFRQTGAGVFSHSFLDFPDGRVCIFLSKVCGRPGNDCIFWSILCCSHAFLCISDADDSGGRSISCVACIPLFLGM